MKARRSSTYARYVIEEGFIRFNIVVSFPGTDTVTTLREA
jgi:hypothetical protein